MGNNNYVDLPKLGDHFLSHKAQFYAFNEYDEFCMETDEHEPPAIQIKQQSKNEFGRDKNEPNLLKHNEKIVKDNEMIEYPCSKEKMNKRSDFSNHELGKSVRSTDNDYTGSNQGSKKVIEIDLTDDIQELSGFDFDDFEFEDTGLAKETKDDLTKDDRVQNSSEDKSTGGSKNINLESIIDVASHVKDKASNRHDRTLKSNNQSKKGRIDQRQHKKENTSMKDGNSIKIVSTKSLKSIVCHDSKDVVPNTPPKIGRHVENSWDYKAPLEQTSRAVDNSVIARQRSPKFNSFSEAIRVSKSVNERKNIPNNSENTSQRETKPQTYTSTKTPLTTRKEEAGIDKSSNESLKESHIPHGISLRDSVFSKNYGSEFKTANEMYSLNRKNDPKVQDFTNRYVGVSHPPKRQGIFKEESGKNYSESKSFHLTQNKQSYEDKRKPKQTPEGGKQNAISTSSFYTSSHKLKQSKCDNSTNNSRLDGNDGHLESDEDLFGSDDGLDEILATSFIEGMDENDQGDTKRLGGTDNDGIDDLLANVDEDIDDGTLVACCDEAMSPMIPVRQNSSTSRYSGSVQVKNENLSKGVKRRLDIPYGQSKLRKSDISDVSLEECPFCAKQFHSSISQHDVNQHIAMCCSSEDLGNDDEFW
ncbi:uncharacterized protein LOC114524114 [Dendronephthya gigantea]|uniref:uncharacterized protein LOC114524114 n=1 Tax=Dendronephthya gigantea TaxID=151771 RepID=UPI00106CF44C|nr:uncharacterized protein LOC114524114 [Dendronephthya gigantea]